MYVIGMMRKSDGVVYLSSKTGGAASKIFNDYIGALEEIRVMARNRSEDYEYLVLKIVASATVANKPVEVKEY